jgi:hypothetical protein
MVLEVRAPVHAMLPVLPHWRQMTSSPSQATARPLMVLARNAKTVPSLVVLSPWQMG